MSPDQQQLFYQLLSGDWFRVVVRGETYAVKRSKIAGEWTCRSVNEGAETHLVSIAYGSCTCPDYKFRNHLCKHVLAIRKVLGA